jgi:hypothetical protein
MAVQMSLNGNSVGDGFLIAPLDSMYDAEIALWTDAGTANVTLQASPNPANLVFSNIGPIALTTTPTIVTVHSQLQSGSRGDTTIQVLPAGGGAPLVNFTVTSITEPVINFSGRFEARFATDSAITNTNPMYTDVLDNVVPLNGTAGWTWGLEGEPEFAPGSPVPANLELTGMGRVIRLNNPIALRPLDHDSTGAVNPTGHVPDVVSKVVSITGKTAAMPPNNIETFTTGDPLIGEPVNFGPHTYFAGNAGVNPITGAPLPMPGTEEYWAAGREPLGVFEIRLGTSFSPPAIYFRGASKVGAPGSSGMTGLNKHTRSPDSRPISILGPMGFPDATQEFSDFSLEDPSVFINKRLDALVADYIALLGPTPATAPPSLQRRNLVRRIGHLIGFLYDQNPADPKIATVQGQAVSPDGFNRRIASVADQLGKVKETYKNGKVDTDLHAWPGGSPGASSVVDYLRQFFSLDVEWHAFAFHTDELCGHHHGWLKGNVTMTGNHIGDPHVHTVNGVAYDFQAVGEFTLLRDGEWMEIQVRQTPVATANPIPDLYSSLTACVSINTAVAARVGSHRIAFQPGREGTRLEFYLDGKPAQLPTEGIDLDSNRVSAFDANGEIGLRLNYDDGTVVTATPVLWSAHNVWYIDVSVYSTSAHEGVMGIIPRDNWLPRLRDGNDLGPMPPSLHDRYLALYETFANSWRVTKETSLFVYAPGTSTATFTDRDWPAEKAPCDLKPQFQVPGVDVLRGMPLYEAEAICRVVTDKDLNANCVFDVATTGDEIFAEGYLLAQELRSYGTAVQVTGYVPATLRSDRTPAAVATEQRARLDEWLVVTAAVRPLTPGKPHPTGTVVFFVDGVPMRRPIELDDSGTASVALGPLKLGEHRITANYSGGGEYDYHSSTSPILVHVVARERDGTVRPADTVEKGVRNRMPI